MERDGEILRRPANGRSLDESVAGDYAVKSLKNSAAVRFLKNAESDTLTTR